MATGFDGFDELNPLVEGLEEPNPLVDLGASAAGRDTLGEDAGCEELKLDVERELKPEVEREELKPEVDPPLAKAPTSEPARNSAAIVAQAIGKKRFERLMRGRP